MIQVGTQLAVADNTGAKRVKVITVLGGTRRRYARIGDMIIGSVREAEPRKLVKKGEIIRGLVVRQRRPYRRKDGSYVRFDDNAVALIEKGKK